MSGQGEVAGTRKAAEDSGDTDSAKDMHVEGGNMACAGKQAADHLVAARRTRSVRTDTVRGDGESHAELVLVVEVFRRENRVQRMKTVLRSFEGREKGDVRP